MRESDDLDELDRVLVTALQTSPRASWQQIGQVLSVCASTAARRWDRLTSEGLAWASGHPLRLPGTTFMKTIIEIDCVAVCLHPVAAAIAEDPHVLTVNHITGSHDLVVIAIFADHMSLGRYLRFRIGHLEGVRWPADQRCSVLPVAGAGRHHRRGNTVARLTNRLVTFPILSEFPRRIRHLDGP
jgi:DNA-binding Lrp family transcriptional regulator